MHACMHEDVHDVVRPVTGKILTGEGEEGVFILQVPAKTNLQRCARFVTCCNR